MAINREASPRVGNWTRFRETARPARKNLHLFLIPVAIAGFWALWEGIIALNEFPAFLLPSPRLVALSWVENWNSGILPRHLGISLFEVGVGFSVSLFVAALLGYLLAQSPLLEKIVSPYLIALQAVPLVALGPFIIIWIGAGIWQNALVAALIAFFPMLVNTLVGIRGIRAEYRELMRSYSANRWQVFIHLEIPAALPVFFGGVRVGMTLSVVGVTVVELLWGDRGLGFLLNFARGALNTPLVFATVATLAAMALSLYGLVVLVERFLIHHRRNEQ
ncbi:MAG: ABC transporter permease [Chloroflexi bacterium]|nr:ABC transporter permease [Chloroflexota bacterium]